ncbi:MAG: hypothetical protein CMJ65_04125 [Planctomycetaceae bacterium]|jgi:hypothetical protein|nr:hypothetical protein [Planctomycetaceae bacterium]MDP7275641.1 hypothetical protein [Planctomycetaceae bacterium]
MTRITRREFLEGAVLATAAGFTGIENGGRPSVEAAVAREKLPIAAVVTEYRNNSHADVIVGKVLEGWRQDGKAGPDLRLVSLYTDQVPKSDMSRGLAKKHGFPIVDSIEQSIVGPAGKDKIHGVLSIGEHGNYPYTKTTRQHMYPRRRFFDAIVAAMQKQGEIVPVFSDKHLSYRFSDALHMYNTARKLKIPFMAGSSLPVCWRYPALMLEQGVEIEEALAVGYGGLESYGFHALETLQCMNERRQGGEAGVGAVRAVQGKEIWKTEAAGKWSVELLEAAFNVLPPKQRPQRAIREGLAAQAAVYLLEHRDGFRSSVVMANGLTNQFAFAAKIKGRKEPVATWFRLEEGKPFGHFEHLLRGIEHMFHSGRPAYPVERTLLTTGVLDRVMHSVAQGGKRLATPELAIAYRPTEWGFANRP